MLSYLDESRSRCLGKNISLKKILKKVYGYDIFPFGHMFTFHRYHTFFYGKGFV